MDKIPRNSLLLICCLIIHAIPAATDTIDASQSIRDGETLVSSGGIFELGFFSPTNSGNRYLGIWYNNATVPTYVWVANREAPLTTKSGVLIFTQPGILALFNGTNGTIIWSTDASIVVGNPAAQLLDSGNLVIKDAEAEEDFIWQSFDYPTDTYLPGMMSMGWNLITGVDTHLLSWRSNDDPSPGNFTAHVDPSGYPQILIKQGRKILYRIGPWNGEQFGNKPTGTIVRQTLVMNESEGRFRDETMDSSVVSKVILSWEGELQRHVLNQQTKLWTTYAKIPSEDCDDYNWCGGYGSCNIGNTPHCGCLERFVPKDVESWNGGDWANGCVRRIELNCTDDVFLMYSGIKLPDVHNSSVDEHRTSLEECQEECSRNCDCMAYAQLNITGLGSGCLFYHGELIDIRTESSGGQELYIRMAYAEREKVAGSKGKKRVILIVSLTSVVGTALLCLSLGLVFAKKRKKIKDTENSYNGIVAADSSSGILGEEAEVPFFSLSTILKATHHFSDTNKLGEGGFGPVYKGILEDGQEIAVKRLSKTSSQGVNELKNEVMLIAKLQHRNLVKLLGCCILGEENILIYEYMSNSSLDLILFDQTKRALLDWQKRFNIINGIGKGLLYLHQDSRLRIIHRDLKASNILLDADMNPKISDFGLARSFGGNETEAKTHRVVGTYGYMSPEYVMKGLYSIKSDVFSFGVLVLEIVCRKRNRDFSLKDKNLNLIGHTWTLYKEDSLWELVDASLGDPIDISQTLRSIHVGLLCIQARPEDRPSMSSVVFMLGNKDEMSEAKQSAFFTERDISAVESSSGKNNASSANQVTITLLEGR
ncbi:hypothetical protein ACS0TY_017154 [Phlomoides rotata]